MKYSVEPRLPRWVGWCSLLMVLHSGGVRADVLISEFLSVNAGGIVDENGDESDWIELTNTGPAPVNLLGWHLTDNATNLTQWTFPAVTLDPEQFLLVFASNKNRTNAAGELHANFKLSSNGEYLGLVRPDLTVAHDYAPVFPVQYPDISYGIGVVGGEVVTWVPEGADAAYLVPTNDAVDVNNPAASPPWNDLGFDDATWDTTPLGIGYSVNQENYVDFIGLNGDVRDRMYESNSTAYVRIPFVVKDPATVVSLTLGIRYDDGFVAYINGGDSPVVAMNGRASDQLQWNSTASGGHADSLAVALESFVIDRGDVTLRAGTNLLAVHGLNQSAGNSDFLVDVKLEGVVNPDAAGTEPVYFSMPTPGAPNPGGVTDLGPIFRGATDWVASPHIPLETQLVVTARVEQASSPVLAVEAVSRIGFGTEAFHPMADDGVAPDALAGDGVFTTSLPLAGLAPGDMFRWRFQAHDSAGTASRQPLFLDPLNSPEYFGVIAADTGTVTQLPVVHWFVEDPGAADTRTGTRASACFRGEFYDNFLVRLRGGSTSGFPKKSYKFDFNPGEHFRFDPGAGRAEEINLNQTWSDKAYMRQSLTFEVYDRSGSPASESYLVRLHRNGQFHALNVFIEQPDKRLLKREGLDDHGALYKMFNGFTSGTSGVEKKNRHHEDHSDLNAFVSTINGASGPDLEIAIFDQVDVPRQLNYLAATVLTQHNDNMKKNYYLYRDSDGSGEWFQMAWDTDLTWGSHFMTRDSSAHDGIWADADYVLGGSGANVPISPSHPFVGTQALPGNRSWNKLIDKLYQNPRFVEMFRRRLRTVLDEVFAPPVLDDRIAELEARLMPDAAEDHMKWWTNLPPGYNTYGSEQTLSQAVDILESDYLAVRRTHLFTTHLAENAPGYPTSETSSALLPGPQIGAPVIQFGATEYNPASGNQGEEYIQLRNPNPEAIDLSGWVITGGVDHVIRPGTVIESGGSLFLSPDVSAFRARTVSPKGGEGHFVQGNYHGQISSRGETLTLLDRAGVTVAFTNTPADPSDAQMYLRITEMHYAPPQGGEYEFLELRNLGPQPLDLAGVNFTAGLDFIFGPGIILAPGELGILVRDPIHYPGATILGTYTSALENNGEQITLRDAAGENVLSYEYDGGWFPPAREGGYSIVIIDEHAGWSTWDDPLSWALSSAMGGSPGLANPPEHSQVFEAWQREYFTPTQISDPLVSGPDADASGDGVVNLMKYALGLDPILHTLDGLPVIELVQGEPVYRHRRWIRPADLLYQVDASPDLEAWTPVSDTLGFALDLGDGLEVLSIPGADLDGSDKVFLRLRATRR